MRGASFNTLQTDDGKAATEKSGVFTPWFYGRSRRRWLVGLSRVSKWMTEVPGVGAEGYDDAVDYLA